MGTFPIEKAEKGDRLLFCPLFLEGKFHVRRFVCEPRHSRDCLEP